MTHPGVRYQNLLGVDPGWHRQLSINRTGCPNAQPIYRHAKYARSAGIDFAKGYCPSHATHIENNLLQSTDKLVG